MELKPHLSWLEAELFEVEVELEVYRSVPIFPLLFSFERTFASIEVGGSEAEPTPVPARVFFLYPTSRATFSTTWVLLRLGAPGKPVDAWGLGESRIVSIIVYLVFAIQGFPSSRSSEWGLPRGEGYRSACLFVVPSSFLTWRLFLKQ